MGKNIDILLHSAMTNLYSLDDIENFYDQYPELLDSDPDRVEQMYFIWTLVTAGYTAGLVDSCDAQNVMSLILKEKY